MGKRRFVFLLLLASLTMGIFVAEVLAGWSVHRKAFSTARTTMSAPEHQEEYTSIYTLQFALPFVAVAAVVIALSVYAFYSDRRGKEKL